MKKLRDTLSLCPQCHRIVPAEVVEEANAIWLVKHCPEHGEQKEIYWSDAEYYHFASKFFVEGRGVENANVKSSLLPLSLIHI